MLHPCSTSFAITCPDSDFRRLFSRLSWYCGGCELGGGSLARNSGTPIYCQIPGWLDLKPTVEGPLYGSYSRVARSSVAAGDDDATPGKICGSCKGGISEDDMASDKGAFQK